ncbi:MAG: hypothetical protein WBE20_02950 [Candidatus Acidiferrales bacterium]
MDSQSPILNSASALEIPDRPAANSKPWSLATRVAFRFCFIYFGLFMALDIMLVVPVWMVFNMTANRVAIGDLPPFPNAVYWVARHVFKIAHPVGFYEPSPVDWVRLFCLLVIAFAGTVVWSILDRKRPSYPRLYAWFRIVVLVLLSATMFFYGTGKIIPVQMWFPRLTRLLERFGDFSPMAVLWNSMGASPAYEVFTGCAEVLGGLLLVFPRTTMLGALICLADMLNVFLLNMFYDVNVKGFSFHLILLAIFLLAPDAKRLLNLFFLGRAAEPASQHPLFRSPRANRMALTVQVLLGLFLLGAGLRSASLRRMTEAGGVPNPPLYGIWDVQDFSLDGQSRPPLTTDSARWRRIVFENIHPWARRQVVTFQNGRFANSEEMVVYGMDDEPDDTDTGIAIVNTGAKAIELFRDDLDKKPELLSYSQPSPGQLVLDGVVNGHKIHAFMKLYDTSNFYLVTRSRHIYFVGDGVYR